MKNKACRFCNLPMLIMPWPKRNTALCSSVSPNSALEYSPERHFKQLPNGVRSRDLPTQSLGHRPWYPTQLTSHSAEQDCHPAESTEAHPAGKKPVRPTWCPAPSCNWRYRAWQAARHLSITMQTKLMTFNHRMSPCSHRPH
jgi:hypothetical protein